jgi:hypothetical protein
MVDEWPRGQFLGQDIKKPEVQSGPIIKAFSALPLLLAYVIVPPVAFQLFLFLLPHLLNSLVKFSCR